MHIGIVGPFNPAEFKTFFSKRKVPEMNLNAAAVQALVTSFLEAGHDVSVFTVNSYNNTYQEFISDNLKIYAVPFRFLPNTSIFKVYVIRQLKKNIKKHLSELDVLHAQWTYEYAYAAKSFAREIPVFCTIRDWCPYIMKNVINTLYKKIEWNVNYYLFSKVIKSTNIHFIANSEYTYSRVIKDYPEKKIVIIPNSIKKKYIKTYGIESTESVKLIAIANGVIDPRKNIVSLLRAYKIFKKDHPDTSLTIVGRCKKDSPVYMGWCEEGLLENVVMTGQLDHDGVIAAIDQSTILIHPSLEETFGNILLEAMARRVPVIGGLKSGAVPIVLGYGKYGVCCDVTSPESICEAILSLTNEAKLDEQVNNATEYLINTFASDVVCDRHIEEYAKYIR